MSETHSKDEVLKAPPMCERQWGRKYIIKGKIRLWKKGWRCVHNKQVSVCPICGGSGLCLDHGSAKPRNRCFECKGASWCAHDKLNWQCGDCQGSSMCEHNKRRDLCDSCGGQSLCLHKTQLSLCVPCRGSNICEHNTYKQACFLCSNGARFCTMCKVAQRSNKEYEGLCAKCYYHIYPERWVPTTHVPVKEPMLRSCLNAAFGDARFVWNKPIDGGCSGRRPDFRFECLTHTVIVECDENQHTTKNYTPECENAKMMETFRDLGARPVVFLRFNPDDYVDAQDVFWPSCFDGRCVDRDAWGLRTGCLIKQINAAIARVPEKEVTVVTLFYDGC